MFNNALNRDTVLYIGMNTDGWQTTGFVCLQINHNGYAITFQQTETLLYSLALKGKVENDFITLDDKTQKNIWKVAKR